MCATEESYAWRTKPPLRGLHMIQGQQDTFPTTQCTEILKGSGQEDMAVVVECPATLKGSG